MEWSTQKSIRDSERKVDGNGRPMVVFEIVTGNWKSIILTTKSKNKRGGGGGGSSHG